MEEIIEQTEMSLSPNRKVIPVPEIPFEKFCKDFATYRQVTKTKEWAEIYSNYYTFNNDELDINPNETKEEVSAYSTDRQIEEMIKCANSFTYFCIKYVKINHPVFGSIPFVPYNYQRRVIDCYTKNRMNILSKFRQGGLTTVSVIWSLWRAMFKTGQRILVVSKTDREAIAAGEIPRLVIRDLPEWLKPETDSENKHEKTFATTNSILWFYTVEAARGKSITILIIDEAAFIKDMDDHWRALAPVFSTGGACQVISTVHGIGNWYEKTYREAEAGKNTFNVIDLDFWEHPLYNDEKWINQMRADLTEEGFRQEILRSFLGSGSTWLNSLLVTKLTNETRENIPIYMQFKEWKNKGSERRIPWDAGALWIWKKSEPGHEYIMGVDAAGGNGDAGDNSCFQIIDANTLEQVAEFYSNSIPAHIFAQVINQFGYYYNSALVVVEDMGDGKIVISNLENQMGYDNIFSEKTTGLKSNQSKRQAFLASLNEKIINGSAKINSYRTVLELNTFVLQNKKAMAQKGSHDDAILALSFAYYARDLQFRNAPPGSGMTDETMMIFNSKTFKDIRENILSLEDDNDFLVESDAQRLIDFNTTTPNHDRGIIYRPHGPVLREFGW